MVKNYQTLSLNANAKGLCLYKSMTIEWDALAKMLNLDRELYEFGLNRFYSHDIRR